MKKLSETFQSEAITANAAMQDACSVLNDYKDARKEMGPDSDGIYILVQGAVKCMNKVD